MTRYALFAIMFTVVAWGQASNETLQGSPMSGGNPSHPAPLGPTNRGPLDDPDTNAMERGANRGAPTSGDGLSRRNRDDVGLERVFETREGKGPGETNRQRQVAWSNLLPMARGDELSRRPDEADDRRRRMEKASPRETERGLKLGLATGEAVDAQVNLGRVDGPFASEIRMILENRETFLRGDARLTNADLTRFDLESDLTWMPASIEWGLLTAYGIRREGLLNLLGGTSEKGRSRDLRLAPRFSVRAGPSAFSLRSDTELGDANAAETRGSTWWVRTAARAEYRYNFSEVHHGGAELRYEYLALPATNRHRVSLVGDWNVELAKIFFLEAAVGASLRIEAGGSPEFAPMGHLAFKWRGTNGLAAEIAAEAYDRAPRDGKSLLDGAWLDPSYPMALERGWRFHLGGTYRKADLLKLTAEVYLDRPNAQAWLQEGALGLLTWSPAGEALYSGLKTAAEVKFGEVFRAKWEASGRWDGVLAPQKPVFQSDLSVRIKIPDTGTAFVVTETSILGEGWKDGSGTLTTLPDRHDLGLRYEQELGKTLQLSAGVRNLLDGDLRPGPRLAAMGRTFFASLRWVY